jgi:type II secretory pathway pseudopilin PulG
LIELAMVCATIGIIGSIAAPRFASAAASARAAACKSSLSTMQRAIDRYVEEHMGQTPAHDPAGDIDTNERSFVARLVRRTDDQGEPGKDGLWGPYLREFPTNPLARCRRIRVDVKNEVGGCAWRFDPATATIFADHVASGECEHSPEDQARPLEALDNGEDGK